MIANTITLPSLTGAILRPAATGFTLTTGEPLLFRGQADRYHKNIAALQLLRQLQHDEVSAADLTDDQRRTLAHYSAFGESALLTRAFERGDDLTALINDTEGNHIKRTALTAFYTPQDLAAALWEAIAPACREIIATYGVIRILEPAAGATGVFIATMPLDIRQHAEITAVELDLVSSQIFGYLHPDVRLIGGTGFEDAALDEGAFDLMISNVPFGDYKVAYPAFKEIYLRRPLHDFFIARALTLVRPGGIVATLTSYGTLDKRDERWRLWMAQRAHLLAAVRIPQGFSQENSGTVCGADLLIFRRAVPDERMPNRPDWTETMVSAYPIVNNTNGIRFTTGSRIAGGHDDDANEGGLRINRWFVDHPAMVVGTIQMVRHNDYLWQYCAPPSEITIAAGVMQALSSADLTLLDAAATVITIPVTMRSGQRTPRAAALMRVYDAAKQVLAYDTMHGKQAEAEQARDELNRVYDALVQQFGPIHANANGLALKGEPELYFLRALETDVRTEDGALRVSKARLFYEPTLRPAPRVVIGQMAPDEALLRCLNDVNRVDLATIAAYSGQPEGAVIDALRGRIYRDPTSKAWETADEYLSGNVRCKLAEARQAAERDPAYAPNVTALADVQPADLGPAQIRANLGAPWIPESDIRDFIISLVPRFEGSSYSKGTVTYRAALAKWEVRDHGWARQTTEATVTWGTARAHAMDIVQDALNGSPPVVYDTIADGDSEKRVINRQETLKAQEKWRLISERFITWVWEDADRAARLCKRYNERFNSVRKRDFDGSHLLLPDLNRTILTNGDLRAHQKDGVWMALQTPAAVWDIPVGGGKTIMGLVWAYEARRLGLARKALIVVPNHLVEQWGAEANRLYPTMRVLVMAPEDFSVQRRGEFLSRIATEDFDVVICAHTSFGFIPARKEAMDYIESELAKLRVYLEELREASRKDSNAKKDNKRSLKELEKKILALETRLKELASARKDSRRVVEWSELGIDALLVDESHEFKNLYVPTNMGNIPGVPKGDSKRSFDMRVKTRDILRRGGRVVFMTGTPIMNTVGEAFIWQTYLAQELVQAHGLESFDAWARTFAEVVPIFEMTPDGGGFQVKSRLARFVNLPELFNLWYTFTFSRSREQLGLPTPALMGGKRMAISVPASPRLKRYVKSLVARVDAIKSGAVKPTEDNMLAVVNDGAKAALDTRMVFGGERADPVNKIGVLADYVAEIYHRYADAKATQLIYCELGTPQ